MRRVIPPPPVEEPRQGLFDRILGRVFPTPGGLLDPGQAKDIQRQGLLQLGMNLLANSQSGQGTLANLGQSYQNVNIPQLVQQAVGAQEVASQRQRQTALQAMAAKYAPQPNETAEQRFERIAAMTSELAAMPGMEDAVGKLSNVLAQLKPSGADTPRLMEVRRGNEVDLVDPKTGQTIRTLPVSVDPNVKEGKDERDRFTRANMLYGRYLQQTKKEADIALNYNAVLSAGNDPSPAGDLSLIFAYMKMLDPGSVVREGEFATAANTGAVPERVRAQYNKVLTGERLTTTQRADFLKQAGNRAKGVQRSLSGVMREYQRRASKYGIDPDDVVYDYFNEVGEPPPSGERPPLDFK